MTGVLQASQWFLPVERLQHLLDTLAAAGYEIIGPRVEQDAIVYRSIRHTSELPRGWSDRQQPGQYRLEHAGHDRYFGFSISPDSWKKYLFPATHELSRARLDDHGWHFETSEDEVPRYAFLGVRACDLAAIDVQDRIFMRDEYVDPGYRRRREAALLIAINCSTANSTCFCTSMGTGPACRTSYDLAMTELDEGFVLRVGSDRGGELLSQLAAEPASDRHRQLAEEETEKAKRAISKQFDASGVHDLLLQNLNHPQWQTVAERCLSCTNCTMVCPTCFCSSVSEVSDLRGEEVRRVRSWDSCFNHDLSYVAGGSIRNSIRSRYRQWLTHKLATWWDQFDVSGCIGCGRCIAWCPVGIDLTEEVAAIRESEHS